MQKTKNRKFRLQDNILRRVSKIVKFKDLYPEYQFARTKVDDIHYIFEVSSGYVVGQGKTYTFARNTSKRYLNFTKGKFNIIVDSYKL